MPPKTKTASTDLTEKNLAIIRAVLCTADGFNPNYGAVKEEYGLNQSGNGARDFRQALAKLGIDFLNGKFIDLTDQAPAAATPTKTAKTVNANGKAKANSQKRKQSAGEDDEAENSGAENVKKPKVDAERGDVKELKVEEEA
ncbi:uncharacterized protein AB675_1145 [Cyphellophora attinorum]|uniref:Uncharacterized protein n=1 Tax=Cyphellophora attinorum TaxID=1664694 RepID=A0A0N0NKE2_9EURO|nr:uncharacterized protein AB675_1145 [Phialophora attinorum]KPI38041.1 hypothetical protein AB675_1145 [Phialophora attinorum]